MPLSGPSMLHTPSVILTCCAAYFTASRTRHPIANLQSHRAASVCAQALGRECGSDGNCQAAVARCLPACVSLGGPLVALSPKAYGPKLRMMFREAFCVQYTQVSSHRFRTVAAYSALCRSQVKLNVNSEESRGILRSAYLSNQTERESNERRGIPRSAYA